MDSRSCKLVGTTSIAALLIMSHLAVLTNSVVLPANSADAASAGTPLDRKARTFNVLRYLYSPAVARFLCVLELADWNGQWLPAVHIPVLGTRLHLVPFSPYQHVLSRDVRI